MENVFCQCRLLMQGTGVITEEYGSSSVETSRGPITGWNGACTPRATKVVGGIPGLLSYLKTFWRSAQQSFTSLCFCVTPAARAGWRLDSWDTLTSSIYHTQACRLGREGLCNTLSGSDQAALLLKWKDVSYHDLTGDVTYFSISEAVQLFGHRHAFPLKEKICISTCEQNVNLRSK